MRLYEWVQSRLVSGAALGAVCVFLSAEPGFAQLSSNLGGLSSNLSTQSSSRFSGSSGRTSTTPGLNTTSGQFMNLGNVNTASQMLGSTTNQGFVGADSSDISNVMSLLQGNTGRTGTRTSTGGISSFGLNTRGLSGLSGNRNRTMTSRARTGRNQQDPIRSALRIGFDVPQLEAGSGEIEPAAVAAKSFTSAVSRMPGAAVEISVQGRTAVLQGTVPSDRERLLAERLALLEPGIERVENRLTVAVPAP